MAPGTNDPEHLLVTQDVFAGPRFWSALNRLADRSGHVGHQRHLVGFITPNDRYELRCIPCDQAVATMEVDRLRISSADGTPLH